MAYQQRGRALSEFDGLLEKRDHFPYKEVVG